MQKFKGRVLARLGSEIRVNRKGSDPRGSNPGFGDHLRVFPDHFHGMSILPGLSFDIRVQL